MRLGSPLPPGIQGLSFDLDDTFWDCAPAIVRAERALHRWFETNAPRVAETLDGARRAAVREAVLDEQPELIDDVTAFRRRIIGKLLEAHDYDNALVDEAFSEFRRARSEVVLYEGVVDLLERLQQHFQVAAITNGNADLVQIGIDGHFEHILAASLQHAPKPAPDMFRRCIDGMAIKPHELLHIGDNAHTDVGGAQAFGARSVWFNQRCEAWPEALPPPDVEVRSISGLSRLLLADVV